MFALEVEMVRIRDRWMGLIVAGAVLVASCTAAAPAPRVSWGQPAAPAAPQVPAVRKTLQLGSAREPVSGLALFGGTGEVIQRHTWVFHVGLTAYDQQGNLIPRVARKVPTTTDGDWKVLPDGGMEVTWKIRPNVKWHDGTPLTADDFVFGIQVARDPAIPLPHGGAISRVRDVVATDPHTLVINWSSLYVLANAGTPTDFPAVPRYLLGELYQQGDKQAFINSPYWAPEFVGIGPYELGEWVRGAYTEGLAFDDYFLGRPKIDRVIIKYFSDVNAMLASLLAGDVDIVMGAFKGEDIDVVRRAWEPTGAGTIIAAMSEAIMGTYQWRDPSAPWVRDVRVRQALAHLVDRQTLADSFSPGASPTDIFVTPDDPVFRLAEQRGFAKYPYDLARGERLLNEAGWTRGSDGTFQNAGQRFKIEVRVVDVSRGNVQQATALADQWKRGGVETDLFVIPFVGTNREARAMSPFYWQSEGIQPWFFESFTTPQLQTAQNNWEGSNLSGFSDPEFDRLYTQYASTLDAPARQARYADLLKRVADEALFLPLYYSSGTSHTTFRRGIRGPGAVQQIQKAQSWNIHEWEMD
jgi:peptide/nickel transport system substrate-binding protein